jgi:hypothetical protein
MHSSAVKYVVGSTTGYSQVVGRYVVERYAVLT